MSTVMNMNMKMAVFRDVALCSLVDVDRRFRRDYCLHHQGDFMTLGLSTRNVIFTYSLLLFET